VGERPGDRLVDVRQVQFHVLLVGQLSSVTVTDWITTSDWGRSLRSTGVVAMASTTFLDSSSATRPKIVCLPFRCGVGPTVMKNWEPLVPRPPWVPAFAMASTYGWSKLRLGSISSSNL